MALSFSQRLGLKPNRTILQVDDMDMELRNSLWNYCDKHFFGETEGIHYICLEEILTDFFKKKSQFVIAI